MRMRKRGRKENRSEWNDKERIEEGEMSTKTHAIINIKILLNTGKLRVK